MARFVILVLALAACPASADTVAQLRQAAALAISGDQLLVANRRSGTVSVLDVRDLRIVNETRIGRTLSDITVNRWAYATDESAGELIRIALDGPAPRVVQRLTVASYPVSVGVAPDGSLCTVASLWSRRLTIVDLHADAMRVRNVIDLPFAPREQCLSPDAKSVIVTDAFGGNLATIDLSSGAITSHRTLQAHNIRGLAPTPDERELLIAHQMLDAHTATEPSRITWGQVVGNVLRAVPVAEVSAAGGGRRALEHWSLYPLGQNGRGAGDPGAIAVAPNGLTAIALSGVDEIALRNSSLEAFRRIKVGRRPTALAFSKDFKRLVVANTSDDTVSIIDTTVSRVIATILLGAKPPLTEEDVGEQLFHDARLSLDGWYSCQSCHTDGHTNAGRNDNFSDGSFATPKQIPSLLGVEESRPWGWNGQMATHEMQVQRSILGTMHGPRAGATADNVNAIAAYIRSLPPAPGVATARGGGDPVVVERGRLEFTEHRCGRCHGKPDYTSERTFDVGLFDDAGMTRFNPPSLLGVSQRDAYLHDGRARSLEDVFKKFGHPDASGERIAEDDLNDLISFLQSL